MAKRYNKGPQMEDWHLWSEVTRSVSPLRPRPEPTPPKVDLEKPAKNPAPHAKDWSPTATPIYAVPSYTPPQSAKQTPAGRLIEPRMRRRLMRGQLAVDATIDLHGLRQSEAHAALSRFVAARYARGDRTLLVITGKGLKKNGYGNFEQRGVLRAMLPRWLSEPALMPMIAGWDVSARTHGGEGAFYVRLRRGG